VTIKKYSETDAEDEWNNQHQQIQGFRYWHSFCPPLSSLNFTWPI
jgi:hypothetical protein